MLRQKVAYQREHTGDAAQDRMQRQSQVVSGQVAACPFVAGKLKSLKFTAGTALVVNHGLGRPAGWFVVRGNYDGSGNYPRISESASQSGINQSVQVSLTADASCTVDVWFYPRASAYVDATGQSK